MTSPLKPTDPSVNGWNSAYLDAQYSRWKDDPASVPADLDAFFRGFDMGEARRGTAPSTDAEPLIGGSRASEDHAQAAVSCLIQEYREVGHLCARTDPFGRQRPRPDALDPAFHGLTDEHLDRTFDAGGLSNDGAPLTLRTIIEILEQTYCGSIGIEFAHISDREQVRWFEGRIEPARNRTDFARKRRAHILLQLQRAEVFEKFCGKRYPGVKRFSLEGGESLIPMLDAFIEHAGDTYDAQEIVFAMSHRGRLNVLTNIIGKTYEQIFTEFEDNYREEDRLGGGDVKYHRGYSADRILPSGKHVWLAMTSNPSHLESADAVALGRCRAKQRLHGDTQRDRVLPMLIHGDAAFIAQGVVAELFNMSQLVGYTVGGTVHIVVNNMIGFTTGEDDARSSRYCTDIAKTVEAPVLHVNGDDPESCVHAIEFALDYRMRFHRDVVIDLLCFRRHGHNESDEAAFTQPLLYQQIKDTPSVLTTYAEHLLQENIITPDDRDAIAASIDDQLDKAYANAKRAPVDPTPNPGHRLWAGVTNEFSFDATDTTVSRKDLLEIAGALGRWPESFTPHRKLVKLLKQRAAVIEEDQPIDWATAELLAIGSLIIEGTIVRMSGQDTRRGTFSQRHAALRDNNTGEVYVPLNHIHELGVAGTDKEVGTIDEQGRIRQAKYCIYDSPLSEFSVLGFDYGFSLASPKLIAIWEAQFGDFSNGAQVIIDQYISSAESKWQRWSGITLLLPHGYEGQGPEHSSARLERFLKLCGENNMQVCYPTTPAQHFHMLRRQVVRPCRKPLIVMTPKSLLRHHKCVSTAADLTGGTFQEVIDDPAMTTDAQRKKVKRLLLCSGKVYYDLDDRRTEIGADDIAIVRVEQLYPIHTEMLGDIVDQYPGAEMFWVQEEPKNAGAWGHMLISLFEIFGWNLPYIGRPESASPATGSHFVHDEELETLLTQAVGPKPEAAKHPKPDAGANGRDAASSKNSKAKAGAA